MCTQNKEHLAIKDEAVSIAPPPIDYGAGSQRCEKAGCNKWALANSRFCANRTRVYLFLIRLGKRYFENCCFDQRHCKIVNANFRVYRSRLGFTIIKQLNPFSNARNMDYSLSARSGMEL